MIQVAPPDCIEQRRTLDQFIARKRKDAAFRKAANRVIRSAYALEQGGNRAGRSDLNHQIDSANINAQLERGSGDQRAQLARLQTLFSGQSQLARQAAMVRSDVLVADSLPKVSRSSFSHAPRVYEHQRRLVFANKLGDAIVNFFPHFVRHHGFERRAGNFNRKIEAACVTRVDDVATRRTIIIKVCGANQKAGDFLNRFLRG